MGDQSGASGISIPKVKRLILAERELANTAYLKNMFCTQLHCFVLLHPILGATGLDSKADFPQDLSVSLWEQ